MLRHLAIARSPFRETEESYNEFMVRVLEARLGQGRLERSLRRVRVAEERIVRFRAEETRRLSKSGELPQIRNSMRRFYGRASSVIHEVDEDLALLAAARVMLRESPHLEADKPTVVVVGYPNVGKSSVVTELSSASPKVAPYPFTTLRVSLGHAEIGPTLHTQVMDTPGLVMRPDRSSETRSGLPPGLEYNAVEREAVTAVEATRGIVLFVLDPSGTCGWTLEEQTRLYERLQELYPTRKFVVAENKVDLLRTDSPNLKISCTTGEGLPELTQALEQELGGSPRRRERPVMPKPRVSKDR